jgi:hypothetical protein
MASRKGFAHGHVDELGALGDFGKGVVGAAARDHRRGRRHRDAALILPLPFDGSRAIRHALGLHVGNGRGLRRARTGAGGASPAPLGRGPGGRRRHVLALARQDRDGGVHGDVVGAVGDQDLGEHAFIDGLDLHGRLVGLDLGQDVAGLDLVAFVLQPFGQFALLHGGGEGRHENVCGHFEILSSVGSGC